MGSLQSILRARRNIFGSGDALNDVTTLAKYTDWVKGILTIFPDARYELKSFATDTARNNIAVYAVFHATHAGQGGRFLQPDVE